MDLITVSSHGIRVERVASDLIITSPFDLIWTQYFELR